MSDVPQSISMPGKQGLKLNIARLLAEAVIVPLASFYLINAFLGLWPALAAAAGCTAIAIVVYLLRGGRPSALLFASAGLAAAQIVVTAMTQSARFFFLEPVMVTYLIGVAIIVTGWSQRPLIQLLALDFVPLPERVQQTTAIRTLFWRLSWLWGVSLVIHASITLAFLILVSTNFAVPLAAASSAPIFLLASLVSFRRFRGSLRAAGFVMDWAGDPGR